MMKLLLRVALLPNICFDWNNKTGIKDWHKGIFQSN